LDVFDEFEQHFHDFLRSTPYIDQILQTSKEYRLVIDSLNILAVSIMCVMCHLYSVLTMSLRKYALWQGSARRTTDLVASTSSRSPRPNAKKSIARIGNCGSKSKACLKMQVLLAWAILRDSGRVPTCNRALNESWLNRETT
jgi:hypothetical protein